MIQNYSGGKLIKIVAMVAAALMTINASAQSHIKVDLGDLAAGTEFEGSHLCALMTESFLMSDAGQSLMTRMNSCRMNSAYKDEIAQWNKMIASLTESRKQYVGNTDETSRTILNGLDENIARCRELISQYSSKAGGSSDATALLREACSHSLGGRLYYGADYIGDGCWAVGANKEYKTANSKYGVINSRGEVVIPFIYNHLEAYPEEKVIRTLDFSKGKQGAIRYDGSVVLDCKYDQVNMCYSSLKIVDNNGNDSRCGIADLNGNIRVPQIHKDIEPFVYNLESGSYVFYVITDNKTRLKAVFDHNYKQITGFLYDGWLNEMPYFIGVKPAGNNDVYDARSWQKLSAIPSEYWNHRFKER